MHWPLKFPRQLHPILDLNCLKIIRFTAAHAHVPVGLKRGPKKVWRDAGCGMRVKIKAEYEMTRPFMAGYRMKIFWWEQNLLVFTEILQDSLQSFP